MATKKKMLQAAAGQAGGAGLDITDVFSTYLYAGNQTARTITNGIDLAGEGGLTWITPRTVAAEMQFIDSERGVSPTSTPVLISSLSNGQINRSGAVTAYNSDGFDLGTYDATNYTGRDMVSWTFRKAPKFFDVVTYTGNGGNQSISHNLGSAPAFIITKRTDSTGSWLCYHTSLGAGQQIFLDLTQAANANTTTWQNTTPTDSVFYLGNNAISNASGGSYVAYLFAHNDGDGEFGPNGDQDIIKCGSYTGNGSTDGPEIDFGFEPQWVLVRGVDSNFKDWVIIDNMRGFVADGNDSQALFANKTNSETARPLAPLSTGFKPTGSSSDVNTNNENYIYIAIRRGPLAPPESGTEVFNADFNYNTDTNYQAYLGAPADMWLGKNPSSFWPLVTRLTGGNYLRTNETTAETTSTQVVWDNMFGYNESSGSPDTSRINYVWKRAPSFFDVVAYGSDNTASQTISHNLAVTPEMFIVKVRDTTSSWAVYHKDVGNTAMLRLNSIGGPLTSADYFNNTSPTEADFTVGTYLNGQVGHPTKYIAYLFASLAGVSKVGSYTGNGTSQTIDCGFTSGARFILIKRTDSTGDWYVWDTERGIVAGNDPHLSLNTTAAEVTSDDSIDPDNSGFIVNQLAATNINVSSAEYIFYAIA